MPFNPPVVARLRRRARSLDVAALSASTPLVVVLIVGTLRKGGFFTPDVVVLPLLCLALAFVSPTIPKWLRSHPGPAVAGVAAIAWWFVAAIVWRHGITSLRLPATFVCAAAGYGVARALPTLARKYAAIAFTTIGVGLSISGFFLVAWRASLWTWADERSLRLAGPLTYPSAIGLYLLLTLIASLHATYTDGEGDESSDSTTQLVAARTVIVLGIVATDSRGALLALVAVLLLFRRVRRELARAILAAAIASPLLLYGQRDGVRPAVVIGSAVLAAAFALIASRVVPRRPRPVSRALLGSAAAVTLSIAGWLLATQHHAVSGIDASWAERGHILRGALTVFGKHVWFGAGPDPWIPTTMLSGAPGVDAFAHNETLEILLSVGIVGVLAIAACALIAIRPLWARRGSLVGPMLAALAAGGLVDFVWHFPALGLLAGAVAALAPHESRADADSARASSAEALFSR